MARKPPANPGSRSATPPPRPPSGPRVAPPQQRPPTGQRPAAGSGPRPPGATIPPRPHGATIPPRPGQQMPPRHPGATIPPRPHGATIPPRPHGATIPPRPGQQSASRSAGATIPPRPLGATIPPRPHGATIPPRPHGATIPPRSNSTAGRVQTAARAAAPAAPPARGRRPAAAAPRSPRGRRKGGRGRVLWPLLILLLLVGVGIGVFYRWQLEFNAPGPAPAAVRVQVSQGQTVKSVLAELSREGAVSDPFGTLMYLRILGRTPRVKAVGTYEFPAQATPAKIIELLTEGRVVLEALTVIEGSTFDDFRRQLDDSPVVTHALRGKSDAQVMAALGHPEESPEGRFFPDTYRFAPGTSDFAILQLSYNHMQHLLEEQWPSHEGNLPYNTAYQALTMASLVEKETGVPEERARIAGVFVNRLRKGMRLQTDPAVAYGLGSHYNARNLHRKDLETDTPYNTYTRGGLPPTPIALPSREAVIAALHPAPTDALYFVATGNGGHHFSRTLEEHDAAMKQWLSVRKQQQAAGGAGTQ